MKRLLILLGALGCLAAAPAERWAPLAARDGAGHAAVAVDLSSIAPGASRGLTVARAILVDDDKTAGLVTYEVQCGRGKLRQTDRAPLDRKTGHAKPAVAVDLPAAKPDGPGEERLYQVVCRPSAATGDVLSTRFAAIFTLSR
jgi:hypothetical protein